jgi:outer membrane lipase/esterase
MIRLVSGAALAAALVLSPIAARAASLNLFTSAWFFGDSLTDNGNLFADTDGQIPPSPPYFAGRTTNGPVWADHVAQDFEDAGLPHQNFAYAFGNAVTNDDTVGPDPLPVQALDLEAQIDDFAVDSAGRLGSRPVATLLFGANDLFDVLRSNPAGVVETGIAAANAVADGIDALRGFGVENFLVFTLPPIEKTPAFASTPLAGLAKAGADTFNATLAGRLAGAANVLSVDLHAAFEELLENPAAFGLENVTEPCFIPPGSLCQDPDKFAFYDGVHPTRVVHAGIAGLARARIAPVPLPAPLALLGVGIAALAVAGRRRRA